MIQDFPVTGIGLGQFDFVLYTFYTPVGLVPSEYVPHAHNLFLDYAVELGVPGALAVAGVLISCCHQCIKAAALEDTVVRSAAVGLGLGLLAYLVYGLTDAIAPGARAGFMLWVLLGLALALGRLSDSVPGPSTAAGDRVADAASSTARAPAPLSEPGAASSEPVAVDRAP
jgi:putative inorganic carbon (HCO3(-)) transporter